MKSINIFIISKAKKFMKKVSYDVIGNIVILRFPKWKPLLLKKIKGLEILKKNKNLTTVLEKKSNVEGELRIAKLRHLAGLKTKKAIYRENDCLFEFDVSKTYFSSRLSNERKLVCEEIAEKLKNKSRLLILFSGVGPYPIVLAKKLKKSKKKCEIIANELNTGAIDSFKRNIKLNKLEDYIKIIECDAKDLPNKIKQKFDIIVMPRPNIEETFLSTAIKLSKRRAEIYYHGFGTKGKVLEEIRRDTKNKISKIQIRKAGDIAPHKYRWQATFKIKND